LTPVADLFIGVVGRATLLVLAAIALRALMRRRRVALRCALHLGTVAALLLLPAAMLAFSHAGPIALPVLKARPIARPMPSADGGSVPGWAREQGEGTVRIRVPPDSWQAGPSVQAPLPSWSQALLLVWMAGIGLGLLRLLVDLHSLHRLSRRATATRGRLERLVRHLAAGLGIGRTVRVALSSRVPVPITWGSFRPVILLPSEASTWPARRCALVLGHELVHVRQLDHLMTLAIRCCRIVYWFHPGVHLLAHQALADLEQRCDELVIRRGTRATVYARTLLDLVRGSAAQMSAIGLAGGAGLAGRIRDVLAIDVRGRVPPRSLLLVTAGSVAALGVAVAAVRLTAAPAPSVGAAAVADPAFATASAEEGQPGGGGTDPEPRAVVVFPPPTDDLAAAQALLRAARQGLGADDLVRRAEATIATEWYRAWLYRAVADRRPDSQARAALVAGSSRIADGYTRWFALEPIVRVTTADTPGHAELLLAGLGIETEHYRAMLLREMAGRLPADPALERLFLDGVGTVTDGYLRYQVLEDALHAHRWGTHQLVHLLALAGKVEPYYARRLLRAAGASQRPLGAAADAFDRLERAVRGT